MCVSEATAARPAVSRVASIRQRSRSGDSSPVCLSQHDIAAIAVGSVVASHAVGSTGGLARSSSDSTILIDTDKHKGQFV